MSSRRSHTDAGLRAAAVLACALLASCESMRGPSSRGASPPGASRAAPAGSLQARLVSSAEGFLGKRTISVGGRRFAPDCTGLVLAIYYSTGLDLETVFPRYSGNGVSRLHSALDDGRLLHQSPRPEAADLVFWDNTYDANGDGRWNDSLTHIGMVMETGREGTVVYVHYNYSRGVVLERMNLARPSLARERGPGGVWVLLNSPMRMNGTARPGEPTLAGELFRDYGRAWRLPL